MLSTEQTYINWPLSKNVKKRSKVIKTDTVREQFRQKARKNDAPSLTFWCPNRIGASAKAARHQKRRAKTPFLRWIKT
jgi:hypothetical protein